jgi:DNA-binding PadR family transcriptional regulator
MTTGYLSARDVVGATVLALLSERPCHPYEMQRLIKERKNDYIAGLPRSLYHAVDRLLKAGLAVPAETSKEGRRPERTTYAITPQGLEELESWLTERLSAPESAYTPVLQTAISLMCCLPQDVALFALRERQRLLTLQAAASQARLSGMSQHIARLFLLEAEHELAVQQMELAWADRLISDIEEGRLSWDPDEVRKTRGRRV